MVGPKQLNDSEIQNIYDSISAHHKKFLDKFGVKMPKLKDANGHYIKDALVLVYLARNYPKTRPVSKNELTQFVRNYHPNTPDVQQARHLGAQSGWWIVAGSRENIVLKVKRGFYQLYKLDEPYPGFTKGHRISITDDWDEIKKRYNYRCATCGSQENQPHLHWTGTKTVLQKAHMDSTKSLIAGNIIPQCQKCNRGDRNRWVYDDKGRVIKLADAGVIKSCDKDVKLRVYRILYNEFKGVNPNK